MITNNSIENLTLESNNEFKFSYISLYNKKIHLQLLNF